MSVLTDIEISYDYNDGVELYDAWQAFATRWRDDVDGVTTWDRYGSDFGKANWCRASWATSIR